MWRYLARTVFVVYNFLLEKYSFYIRVIIFIFLKEIISLLNCKRLEFIQELIYLG